MRKFIIFILLFSLACTGTAGAFAPPVPSPATASNASTLEGHAANYFQVDVGLTTAVKLGAIEILANGAGYLKNNGSGTFSYDTPAGDISQSGSPANHYWAYFTADKTITGVAITASKPVCSDANGNPAVCAGTEGVWQPVNASLTALSGLSSPITVDGNNITVPGALITTAEDGHRKLAVLANTVGVDATADSFELYPDSDDLWKINQHGTEYTFVLNGLATGGLIFGDASPDAAGEIGYDGELKYYDAVGSKTVATVGGALGTPSFTALNMPSSNADPGTTPGQIKHDSTDSNAASDGSFKWFSGNHVNTVISASAVADDSYTIITKTEYLPIAYAEDGAAAPAAASVWADTRKAKIRVFAADADDDVEFHWMVPDDYVGGIKFRVIGFVDNATAPADTETVIMNLAGCSVGNSDDGGCTLGTGVDSTFTADATYAQHDRWSSAWSNEITVTNILAGESAMLKLFRDVDDTYGQGIGVAGIEIKYKARVLMADRY